MDMSKILPFIYFITLLCREQHKHRGMCINSDLDMVVTSSNSAYGVVSTNEDHEYEEIELQQMHTQHT